VTENQDVRALLRELASSVRGKKLTNYWYNIIVNKYFFITKNAYISRI